MNGLYDDSAVIKYERWREAYEKRHPQQTTETRVEYLDRIKRQLRLLLKMLITNRTQGHERLGSWAVKHILVISEWLRRVELELEATA